MTEEYMMIFVEIVVALALSYLGRAVIWWAVDRWFRRR